MLSADSLEQVAILNQALFALYELRRCFHWTFSANPYKTGPDWMPESVMNEQHSSE